MSEVNEAGAGAPGRTEPSANGEAVSAGDTVVLHPRDEVAIALRELRAGETVTWPGAAGEVAGTAAVLQDVPRGHKILIRPVAAGQHVHKFGYSIGIAKADIPVGSWVHTHNLKTGLGAVLDYAYKPRTDAAQGADADANADADGLDPGVPAAKTAFPEGRASFQGYVRDDGEVGIRNEIWIVNTVGCINKTCETLARLASRQFEGRGIDGVFHFPHPYGCSQLGDDLTATQKLLTALVRHGNAAGVLVVGLGCENNQVDAFKQVIGDYDPERVKFMKAQEVEDELEEGLTLIGELVDYAERFVRTEVPLSKLRIGLKCGGSDGFSGITANPLVGRVADAITAAGGTALLTEVPEMFGAETILMDRAADEAVFDDIVKLVNDFKAYFIRHGQEIYENPSPGNKDGGITTLEEKSLGCTQKGGHATVTDVLPYGEPSRKPGLNLVQAPGNDLVSVTALAAAGAHVVLFTTGRGTPFGGPVPTVKIATNTALAERKKNWIDFNAGRLIEGMGMDALRDELLAQIVALASGERRTNNELNGFREIAIFKDGVIL
ncbi:UxaA family hydrolase [Cohnella sp. JJ-181]|uniref:UxaA family hydrolase n=1 Tax=Cohnella rhizoplanae TaxID=2974897 RepID=UPI0022FF6CA0|nr:altronate dehydratase family protein [Cohnella sp. JJ-181]CAI6086674.1 Altronate dehydratase [Cohnella sp. JJ-181]